MSACWGRGYRQASKHTVAQGRAVKRLEFCYDFRTPFYCSTLTSVSSNRCPDLTCFRIGSKFLRIRSTATATQSISENDIEPLAKTGVNCRRRRFHVRACKQILEKPTSDGHGPPSFNFSVARHSTEIRRSLQLDYLRRMAGDEWHVDGLNVCGQMQRSCSTALVSPPTSTAKTPPETITEGPSKRALRSAPVPPDPSRRRSQVR